VVQTLLLVQKSQLLIQVLTVELVFTQLVQLPLLQFLELLQAHSHVPLVTALGLVVKQAQVTNALQATFALPSHQVPIKCHALQVTFVLQARAQPLLPQTAAHLALLVQVAHRSKQVQIAHPARRVRV